MADAHGTEVGPAHRAIFATYVVGSLVIVESPFRVERQVELVFPTEVIACLAQCVVSDGCSRMTFRQVGSMSGYLVSDHSDAHIFLVGQCQMLFWSDVAKHRRAIPTYLCRTDGTGDMVVARCDICDKRT